MVATKPIRNVALILLVALATDVLPGGGTAAGTIREALYLAFLGVTAWGASRLYREHRVALYSLGDRNRLTLYGGIAVIILMLIAKTRMWETTIGELAWIALIASAMFAIFQVFRASREY